MELNILLIGKLVHTSAAIRFIAWLDDPCAYPGCNLRGNHHLGESVNLISDSKPLGGSTLATFSGIGGNVVSRIDCRHTAAETSLEVLFLVTFASFILPLGSTQNETSTVPKAIPRGCSARCRYQCDPTASLSIFRYSPNGVLAAFTVVVIEPDECVSFFGGCCRRNGTEGCSVGVGDCANATDALKRDTSIECDAFM
jgi:hypothetical protein